MRKIKIITDSTADLSYNLLDLNEVEVVPLPIMFGEKIIFDDRDLTSRELFKYAEEHNVLPKTSAVNEHQFEEIFKKWLDSGYDIFFLGVSSKLSCTVQNALAAANQFDKDRISIVDSMSLSTGLGLLVLEACEIRDRGASLQEITDKALTIRSKARVSFVVDTLKYLYMGGRCSKLTSIMGTKLQIKPMLEVINGEVVPTSKFRGSRYVDKYFDQVMENEDKIDTKRIFVTNCLSGDAEKFKKRLETEYKFENIYTAETSATISTHCGPGTIGILYLEK